MINIRGTTKQKFQKPQKVFTNISTLEIQTPTPPESDRSLLIHDDEKFDILSDLSSSCEIRDKDIPVDKRNIINDSTYFKQLSLSFYGEAQSPKQTNIKTEADRSRVKKETGSSKLNTSLSPRSDYSFYYGLKRPANIQFEKNAFHMNFSSLMKQSQKSQNSLKSSRTNLSQNKDKSIDSKYEAKSPKNIAKIEIKDLKMYKVNTGNVLASSQVRNSSRGMYPQFATTQTTTATTPRYNKNFWDPEIVRNIRRPSVKKVTANTKPRVVNQEYMLSEPMSNSLLKNSNNSSGISQKLKMYAMDNSQVLNVKVVMGQDGKIQSNKAILHERTSASPAMRGGIQGVSGKRKVVPKTKGYKNSSYYD